MSQMPPSSGASGAVPGSAVPSAGLPPLPDFNPTLGALLVGLILSTALWGVGCTQAYWFYDTFKNERRYLKTLVAISWVLDTTQQALIGHVIYTFTITNYFNPLFLDHYIWSLWTQSLFECLTSFTVQAFFAYRIFVLSEKNYFVAVLPCMLVLAKLAIGLAYVIINSRESSITMAIMRNFWTSKAVNAITMTSDVFLALFMVVLLARAKTGIKRSDNLLNRLMLTSSEQVYTVNTGLITSVCATITLILATVFPANYLYSVFYFMTGKLYFNTMLASLNARRNVQKESSTVVMMSGLTHSATDSELPPLAARSGTQLGSSGTTINSNRGNNLYDYKATAV
ncbi:hypothetical protein E1B28_001724 [Marasmius oreades]|uniref:DUF6534 domain-containing protein n=1 Tax=Marasmius oreades TaxID=181124 RepID=A0A9P7V465_9AGAR|nr:uncharacterized protein E1B28_001724 [Marasmius oreades]KAG7099931.1 hypothetical protein E1B28_001724 [Marasmius oreades]